MRREHTLHIWRDTHKLTCAVLFFLRHDGLCLFNNFVRSLIFLLIFCNAFLACVVIFLNIVKWDPGIRSVDHVTNILGFVFFLHKKPEKFAFIIFFGKR